MILSIKIKNELDCLNDRSITMATSLIRSADSNNCEEITLVDERTPPNDLIKFHD